MSKNDISEFDKMFSDILKIDQEPAAVETPVLKMETTPTVQVAPAAEVSKPKYRTVEGKVDLDGGPCKAKVYPKGYVQFELENGSRFFVYEGEYHKLKSFFQDEEATAAFEAQAKAAGFRDRSVKVGG